MTLSGRHFRSPYVLVIAGLRVGGIWLQAVCWGDWREPRTVNDRPTPDGKRTRTAAEK